TFDEVISFGGGRNFWRQLLALTRLLPRLWRRRYEVVLDLQNSRLSRLACAAARPRAWARFEKFAAYAAGERTQATIAAVWDWPVALDTSVRSRDTGVDLLAEHGVHSGTELVVLNPAGNMSSRSWPVANYIEFARLWREQSPGARFVLLLLPAMRAKAGQIAAALGTACIDLTGVADAVQAFGIVGASRCVLSEDSGLMHMAWVQGVPTLALFSSSRADWARPLGPRSHCLHSADLDCGPCGRDVCRFGDNRCLTRYSARHVFELARHLSGS
ncbi:MAG TPA: glycosyltransferase family 9 protein, partial [Steroidobacteraceae bacterium]|nr:glycosyltransferase family 9 protein [Steroidobacteraceae bacterium]